MKYREELPPECPPAFAKSPSGETYWRLISNQTATQEDFDSHSLKKPHIKYSDACKACGISLVPTLQGCRDLMLLRRMKVLMTYALQIKLIQQSGSIHQDKPTHVVWWIAHGFDPLTSAVATEKLK